MNKYIPLLFFVWIFVHIQIVEAQDLNRYDSLLRIYQVNSDLGVNKKIQIENLIDLAAEINLSNPDKAIHYLQTALQLAHETEDKSKEAYISSLLGDLYLNKNLSLSAIDYFLKSYIYYRDAMDSAAMAYTLINLGNVSFAEGVYDLPMQNYRQAYKIFSQINNEYGMSVALTNLGLCKKELLDYDSALYFMNEALRLRENLGNPLYIAYSLAYIASIQLKKKDFIPVFEAIDKAMFLLNSNYQKQDKEVDELRISLYQLKGKARSWQGDYNSAFENFNSAWELAEKLHSDNYKIDLLRELVSTHYQMGNLAKAIEINKQRIALCERNNLIESALSAYHQMAELYREIGRYDSAMQYYNKSSIYSDSLRQLKVRNNFFDIDQAFRLHSLEQQERMVSQKMHRRQLITGIGIAILFITGIFVFIYFRKIRNSRREFETLSEAAFEGIIIHERGLIININSRFSEMIKMTPESLKGKNIYDFVIESDRQRVIELSRDNPNEVNYQTQLIVSDYTIIQVEILSKPFVYRGKKARVEAVRDITEYQKLIQVNLVFRSAIQQMGVSLVLTDSAGNIVYVNPFFTTITGYTPDEAKGKNPRILKSGYHSNAFYKNLWDTITQGNVWKGELYNKRKDGTFYWEKAVISPVKNASGQITHFVAIKEDITQMKNQENELRKRSLMYRYLAKNLPGTAVFVFNKNLICILSEGPALKEIGYSVNSFEGSSLPQFFPEAKRDELSQKLEGVFKGEGCNFVTTFNQKNYEVVVVPMKDDNNQVFQGMVMLTDITEKLRQQETLKKSEEQLKIALATKDRFISILAHDLRSPFASILGLCDILLDDYHKFDDEVRVHYLQLIRNSSNNVLELLNNLLNWSRAQSGMVDIKPRVFNVSSFLLEIVNLMNLTASQKNISLLVDVSHDADIYADPDILGTILRNLISNAIKYSNPGGEVFIRGMVPYDYSTLKQNNSDCWIVFSVADKGVGMTREELSQLFHIDSVTSKEGTNHEKGTGLGLLLVKELVDKIKGHIHVESQSGQGTIFYIEIPCEYPSNNYSL